MKKLLLILALLFSAAVSAHAQQTMTIAITREGGGSDINDIFGLGDNSRMKTLDDAYLECVYNLRYLIDTLAAEGGEKEDVMKLHIGPKASKFFSHKTYLADSTLRAEISGRRQINVSAGSKYEKGQTYIIYKDREKDKLEYIDLISFDFFRYEEPLEVQDWEILDETRDILGYECQKAVCDFRGRSYEAWFTWEIPVSEGPWKFCGLPGLIMSVADTQGHYTVELAGISEVQDTPIQYADAQYHKTKRRDFLKTLHKYASDPIGYMVANSGAKITVTGADGSPMSTDDMNFMSYDFMERDYK